MKRVLLIGIFIVLCLLCVTGCGNKQIWDTEYTFNYAYCYYDSDKPMKLEVKKWTDYDGDQLQIITPDGNTYLVTASRCMLTYKAID